MSLAITWLGHSTFLIELPGGTRILTDPWLSNPNCPAAYAKPEALGKIDVILVTHGHGDHTGDLPAVARATGAPVVCVFELATYLSEKGLQNMQGMNCGGTMHIAGLAVTMTTAHHSGSIMDGSRIVYAGGSMGYVVRAPHTPTIYIAGDTALFGDMKMIGEIYRPEIAFLPIGDLYTMGPDTAAIAARWLGVRQVVPMHWGTFPVLTGTPAALKSELTGSGIDVLELKPGERAQ